MAHEAVARGVAVAGNDVDDAGGHARLIEEVGKAQRGERGLLGGLEDHGAAGGQRRADLEHGHEQREVPWHDLRGYSNGLAADIAVEGPARGRDRLDKFAAQLGRPAGHVVDHADGAGHIDGGGHALGLAVVDGLQLGELVGMGGEQIGELVHDGFAHDGRQVGPAAVVERAARGGDGAIDIGIGRVDEAAHHLARAGIDHIEGRAAGRVDPAAIDEELGLAGQRLLRGVRIRELLKFYIGDQVHDPTP